MAWQECLQNPYFCQREQSQKFNIAQLTAVIVSTGCLFKLS